MSVVALFAARMLTDEIEHPLEAEPVAAGEVAG
jgi:hypothetical protein